MASPSSLFVKDLQARIRRLENSRRPERDVVSSGLPVLDRLLPDRGFRRGTLIEWLGDKGSGAATLAILAAREACREREAFLVIDKRHSFYPPAAASLGIDLAQTTLVRPWNEAEHRWAWNQALRCSGVGAVLGWPEKLDPQTFRRWQLAAETGGAIGLLLRPPEVRGHPAWSEIQLFVEPLPNRGGDTLRRLRVEVTRSRDGRSGASVELELDDATGAVQPSRPLLVASTVAVAAGA